MSKRSAAALYQLTTKWISERHSPRNDRLRIAAGQASSPG
jgi:hypothetical protein